MGLFKNLLSRARRIGRLVVLILAGSIEQLRSVEPGRSLLGVRVLSSANPEANCRDDPEEN